MTDGKLCASANSGGYAIGSPYNPDLATGQAVELLLGGHWLPGHIASSDYHFDSASSPITSLRTQSVGAYSLAGDNGEDTVTEASEESFPASDSPAWTASPNKTPERLVDIINGYYFIADADGCVCGLCIGMRIRTKDTFAF